MPGRITLPLEPAEIGGGDGERAVIEEMADRLHRLRRRRDGAGGGMAEDIGRRRRETGQAEIAPEAVVEGGAGDALGTGAGLP